MHWFKFKDRYSVDFNLLVSDLGRRQRAEEQIEEYEVPYRNENLIIHTNRYKPYLREMTVVAKDIRQIDRINAWLRGRGKMRTSIDEGGFFYASIFSGLDYEEIARDTQDFRISFKVDPFFYLDSGQEIITITEPIKLINPGTYYAEPIITIFGTGDITLNINGDFHELRNVENEITIDSNLQVVYRDTLNQSHKFYGDNFPVFNIGDININCMGNVSKIEIIPRWRML